MAPLLLLLIVALTPGVDSLVCQCANSTSGRNRAFCDIERPLGCQECEGDVAAERAYRQLQAILSRVLDAVMQGRDKNCCLVRGSKQSRH